MGHSPGKLQIARFSGTEVVVENYPADDFIENSNSINIGDFASDGTIRIILSSGTRDLIYEIVDGNGAGLFEEEIIIAAHDDVRILGLADIGADGQQALFIQGAEKTTLMLRPPFDGSSASEFPYAVSWIYDVADFTNDGIDDLVVAIGGRTVLVASRLL